MIKWVLSYDNWPQLARQMCWAQEHLLREYLQWPSTKHAEKNINDILSDEATKILNIKGNLLPENKQIIPEIYFLYPKFFFLFLLHFILAFFYIILV
jgi:hypothetical protein